MKKKRRKERRKNNKDFVKERAYILQTFYHKNMFKNTLNFKMNSIVKLFDIFEEKNSCPNCLAYFFFDHWKIFDHLAFWYFCNAFNAFFRFQVQIQHIQSVYLGVDKKLPETWLEKGFDPNFDLDTKKFGPESFSFWKFKSSCF